MIHTVRKIVLTSATLGAALLYASLAWSVPPPAGATAPSREVREKMAVMHDQMAACLRSDKPIAQCHREMMAHCRAELGARHCRMMQRRGMGAGRRMQPSPPPPPPSPPPAPSAPSSTPP